MTPFVIGIGGGTASGKTTVAAALAERLGDQCRLLIHDRYYHSLPEDLLATPILHNFDHPDALDTARLIRDLDQLRAGIPTSLPVYEFHRHSRAAHEEMCEPRPILVVEGILVLDDPQLRRRFDHAVFVDTPDDLRLMRRIRRDLAKRGRTVHDVLDQYERTVRPMHEAYVVPSRAFADQVLNGTRPVEGLVDAILSVPSIARHATA